MSIELGNIVSFCHFFIILFFFRLPAIVTRSWMILSLILRVQIVISRLDRYCLSNDPCNTLPDLPNMRPYDDKHEGCEHQNNDAHPVLVKLTESVQNIDDCMWVSAESSVCQCQVYSFP